MHTHVHGTLPLKLRRMHFCVSFSVVTNSHQAAQSVPKRMSTCSGSCLPELLR
jgi:hypothetical protein